jgi:hypothetical protein
MYAILCLPPCTSQRLIWGKQTFRFSWPGSASCRSLPPTMQFSVSLLEKTDAQIHHVSGRVVPTADTYQVINFGASAKEIALMVKRQLLA